MQFFSPSYFLLLLYFIISSHVTFLHYLLHLSLLSTSTYLLMCHLIFFSFLDLLYFTFHISHLHYISISIFDYLCISVLCVCVCFSFSSVKKPNVHTNLISICIGCGEGALNRTFNQQQQQLHNSNSKKDGKRKCSY